MARIVSVMAGLACALAMCFAVPIASAAPTDHLLFDSGPGLDLVAAPTMTELSAVADVFDFAVPMISAAAADVEKMSLHAPELFATAEPAEVGCTDDPSARTPLSEFGAIGRLTACTSTSRHYDPGWRVG